MVVKFPENLRVTPQNRNEQVVFDFLTNMGPTIDDVRRDFAEHLADDIAWGNVSFPTIHGKPQVMEHVETLYTLTKMEYCTIDIFHMCSFDDTVLTERLDIMYAADDVVIVEYPIMGAFDLRHGKITRYFDYFDSVPTREAFPSLFDKVVRRSET